MKTATEIQLEALAIAYDSLRLYTEDMTPDEYESDAKREADLKIGAWLSAALEDPSTCQSMKDDINEWFACTPQEKNEP